ncbi:hypothetical protein BHM03_00043614 [Ensete ventricosum]|nr:hypothetical protein BHM03_00043614 [Ensete ventricosum]
MFPRGVFILARRSIGRTPVLTIADVLVRLMYNLPECPHHCTSSTREVRACAPFFVYERSSSTPAIVAAWSTLCHLGQVLC